MTRACVILSNGYSRVESFAGTGVGNLPSIGHTVFGGLNSGLLVVSTVIGPLVNIDAVGSMRLFELIGFGLIAMAVAMPALLPPLSPPTPPLPANNPLEVDGRSAFDINGVIVIAGTTPDGIIGVTGDCCGGSCNCGCC